MKPTTFLFLFCFSFLVSATTSQITSAPFYWTETLPSTVIAVMPDTTFTFGNSTNGPLNVALRTPNAFDLNTNYQAQFFYPYNTSTGLNTSFSGKLILRGFRAYFSGAAPVVTWHLQQTNTGNGCNGTDLATGTLQAEGGGAWEDAAGINAVLETGKSHCLRFDATSTVATVIGGDDNDAGNILGYRGSTTALANWAWDTGDELGIQFNFTEYVPVRSPLITTNRSNGNITLASAYTGLTQTGVGGETVFNGETANGRISIKANWSASGSYGYIGAGKNGTFQALFFQTPTATNIFTYNGVGNTLVTAPVFFWSNQTHTYSIDFSSTAVTFWIDGINEGTIKTTVPQTPLSPYIYVVGYSSTTDYAAVENTLPSGATVQLWANGSGTYNYGAYNVPVLALPNYLSLFETNYKYDQAAAGGDWVLWLGEDGSAFGKYFTYKFDAPSGFNFSGGTAGIYVFEGAAGRTYTIDNSTDGITWTSTAYNPAGTTFSFRTLAIPNTKSFYLRINETQNSRNAVTNVSFYATLSNSSALSLPVLVSGANNVSATVSNGSTNYSITTLQTNPLQNNPNYANWTTWQNQNASITYSAYTPAGQFLTASGQAYVGGTARTSATAFNVSTVTSGYNRTDITTINWTVTAPTETLKVNTTETSLVVYTPANALMNCSFLSSAVALNFSTLWEGNRTTVLGTQAGTFTYRVNSTDDTTPYNYSSSAASVFSWPICIYPTWATAWVNSSQEHYNDSTKKRNYYLYNASVTNSTNAISLYVPEPQAQLVQITLKDGNGVSQAGYYLSFQRYFLDTNTYSEVARGLTSANGDVALWLRPNDAIYNILVYNATGGVVATYTSQNIPCDPALSICTITMFLPTVSTAQAYQTLGTTSYSCALTNSSANCTFIDTSGLSRNFTLAIIKHGSLLTYEVCRTWLATSSGTLFCNATDWTANTRYSYTLWGTYSAFSTPLESGWLPYLEAPAFGTSGIIIALFLALIMGLVGAWSPTVSLGFGVLVLISSLGMGLLPAAAAYGAVLGFTVMAIMFMVKMNS